MIRAVIQGAVVLFLFCFAGYGVYYALKKIGFVGWMQKAIRPKPTKEIYDDIKKILSKGKFDNFAEGISKYDLRKQRQYIDAYLDLKEEKLKGGDKKHGEERPSKKSVGKEKKAGTRRTTTKRNSSTRK